MRRSALAALALAALVAPARAEVVADGDRAIDHDDDATCRALHARGPSAACPRHARITPTGIVLVTPVRFEIDKATLTVASRPILDELVAILVAHPTVRLEIQGHYRDEPDRARQLSRDRAEAVHDYLISRGIDRARLEARGYGETRPLVLPATDRRNWRIELVARP